MKRFAASVSLVALLLCSTVFTGLGYFGLENHGARGRAADRFEPSKVMDSVSVEEVNAPVAEAKAASKSDRREENPVRYDFEEYLPHYTKTGTEDDQEKSSPGLLFGMMGVSGQSGCGSGDDPNVTVTCYDINGDPLYLAQVTLSYPAQPYMPGISGFTNSSGVFEAINIPSGTIDVCVGWGNASAPGQPGYHMYLSNINASENVDVVVDASALRSGGGLANVTLTILNSTGGAMTDTRLYMGFSATTSRSFAMAMGPMTDAEGNVTLYLSNDTWAPDPTYYTFLVCQMTPANNTLFILTDRLVTSDEAVTLTMPSPSAAATVELAFPSPSEISLIRDIRLFFEWPGVAVVPPEMHDDLALMYLPSKLDGEKLFAVPLGTAGAIFLPVAEDNTTSLCLNASLPFQVAAVFTNATEVVGGPWLYIPMNMSSPIPPGGVESLSMGGTYLKLRSVTPLEAYLGSAPKLYANFTDAFYNPLMSIAGNGSTSLPTGFIGPLSYMAVYNLTIWYNGSVWYDGQATAYGGLNGILSGVPPFPTLEEVGTYNYSIFIDAGPWPLDPPGTEADPLTGSFEVIVPKNNARFTLRQHAMASTRDDSISPGVDAEVTYGLILDNRYDSYYESVILGDLRFNASAHYITWVDWQEHAQWNETWARWAFPQSFVVPEGQRFGTNFGTNYTLTSSMGITRELNQTDFDFDGYQSANFTITFTNTSFLWCGALIYAWEGRYVNASIVPGTFETDAPLERFDEKLNWVNFQFRTGEVKAGVNYNFSVVICVDIRDDVQPPVFYKPYFGISILESQLESPDGEDYGAVMPPDMLPGVAEYASVETNASCVWTLVQENYTSARLFEISEMLGPRATFSLEKNLGMWTESDDLLAGNYELSPWFNMGINNDDDDTDTVLGDLGFYVEASNITRVGWGEHAVWDSSHANWTFPPEFIIRENEGFGTDFSVEHSESRYVNVTLGRWVNETTFTVDGYQLANFNATFTDTDFLWTWGNIGANENWMVNASIVPGTFWTDAPYDGIDVQLHWIHISLRKDLIQPGVTYNFSVVVKVELKPGVVPPILYKPGFHIGYAVYQERDAGGADYVAQMPPGMLPDYVSAAQASTNTSNIWTLDRKDNVFGFLGEVSRLIGPRATFGLDRSLNVWTEEDTLVNGSYMLDNIYHNIWINNDDDDTDTVLGNLIFNATAENITWVAWEDHANWTSSSVNWTFPEFIIPENQGFGTGFNVARTEGCDLNLTISRWMNVTEFSADGYQLVTFTVNFTNTDFLFWCWGNIYIKEEWAVNASIENFWTDAPLEWSDVQMRWVNFNLRKDDIVAGVNYTFTVIIRVDLTGNVAPPIVYKPGFSIGYGALYQRASAPDAYIVEMPPEMRPGYVSVLQASTNTSNIWTLERRDHVGGSLEEVCRPVGARATFTFAKNLGLGTDQDALTDEGYPFSISYHMGIWNEDDDTDTVLGNLIFNATAENITWVAWEDHANWTSSSVNWTFPEFIIPENIKFEPWFNVENVETAPLNLMVTRWMNQTVFNADGYQLVRFTVNFANTDFLGSWGRIEANERGLVNASIVPGTFWTDASLEGFSEDLHWIHFNLRKDDIVAGVDYTFTVVIKVELTAGLPAVYKPRFDISREVYYQTAEGGEGYGVEMPPEMLPVGVTFARVETNATNYWRLERRNYTALTLNEVATKLDLAVFPMPFVANGVLDCAFVVGDTWPHGPLSWQAWTVDVLGAIGVAGRLGLESQSGTFNQFVDTDIATYNATSYMVAVDWSEIPSSNVVSVGSSFVNIFTLAYERFGGAPFYMTWVGGQPAIHSDLTGENYTSGWGYDYAVIALFYDGSVNRHILLVYGVTGKGSQAACMILQYHDAYLSLLTGRAVIIRWQDLNYNGRVDMSDEVTMVESWS